MPYRILIAALGLLLLQPVHAVSIIDSESTAPAEVAREIETIILRWKDNWNNSNWKLILNDWDPDDEAPSYLGEERDRWLIGREGLESYFNPPRIVRMLMGNVIMQPYRLRVRLVSDNIAIVTWENKLEMDIRNRPAISDNFRANAVLRRKPDGWKFIHYAEAPLAPLAYVEHLYRKSVRPDYFEVAKPMDRPEDLQ